MNIRRIFIYSIFALVLSGNALAETLPGTRLYLPESPNTSFPKVMAVYDGDDTIDLWDSDPLSTGWILLIDGKAITPADDAWVREERESDGVRRIGYSDKTIDLIQDAVVSGEGSHVRIVTTIVNNGAENIEVLPSLLLDSSLGEMTGLPFLSDDGSYSREEILVEGNDIPAWIKTVRDSRTPVLTIILDGKIPSRPESIQAANWLRMKQAPESFSSVAGRSFDYLPFSENDSALLLTWKSRHLSPGESYEITVLIGMDENPPDPELFDSVIRTAIDADTENVRLREYTIRQRLREIGGIIDELNLLLSSDIADDDAVADIMDRVSEQERLRAEYENL